MDYHTIGIVPRNKELIMLMLMQCIWDKADYNRGRPKLCIESKQGKLTKSGFVIGCADGQYALPAQCHTQRTPCNAGTGDLYSSTGHEAGRHGVGEGDQ